MTEKMENNIKAKDFYASTLAREHYTYYVNTVTDSQRPTDIFAEMSQWQYKKDHLQFSSVHCSGDRIKRETLFHSELSM